MSTMETTTTRLQKEMEICRTLEHNDYTKKLKLI